jgi:hypothetical protein
MNAKDKLNDSLRGLLIASHILESYITDFPTCPETGDFILKNGELSVSLDSTNDKEHSIFEEQLESAQEDFTDSLEEYIEECIMKVLKKIK